MHEGFASEMVEMVEFDPVLGTIYVDADLTNMNHERWNAEASRWRALLSRYPNLQFGGNFVPKGKCRPDERSRRAVTYWFKVMIDGEVGGEIWYFQQDKIEMLVIADDKPGCAELVLVLAQQIVAMLGGRFEQEAEP